MAQISPERRERMQREKQMNASGGGNYFSFKNLTKAQIRLAPLQPDENIGTKIVFYFINNKSYLCNEQTNGKPGVIARTIRALQKLDSPEAADLVEAFTKQRKSRFLMKIIDRAEADKVIWAETPKAIYDVIFKAFDEDGEDLAHPREGRDIRISKTGSGLATEYSARILDQCPLADTKEQRIALKQQAAELSVEEETRSDEARTLEAIKGVIPKPIWAKIHAEVVKGIPGLDDGDGDAAGGDDEDEAPAPKAGKKAPPKAMTMTTTRTRRPRRSPLPWMMTRMRPLRRSPSLRLPMMTTRRPRPRRSRSPLRRPTTRTTKLRRPRSPSRLPTMTRMLPRLARRPPLLPPTRMTRPRPPSLLARSASRLPTTSEPPFHGQPTRA